MTSTVMSCNTEASGAILYSFCMSTKLKQSTLQMRKEAQEKKIISGNSTIALNKLIDEIGNKFLGLFLLQLISK